MKKLLLVMIFIGLFSSVNANDELMLKAKNTFELISRKNKTKAYEQLLRNSKAVIIFPEVTKVGFILGGLGGNGVMISLDDQRIVDAKISGGSIGIQMGYKNANLVFFILKQSIVMDIKDAKITLGADMSYAFGDKSNELSSVTDIKFSKNIYIFTDNSGFFAGASLGGTVISSENRPYDSTSYAATNLLNIINSNH